MRDAIRWFKCKLKPPKKENVRITSGSNQSDPVVTQKEVNRRQLFDIGITEEGLAGRKEEEDQEKEEEEPAIPKFNPQLAKGSPIRLGHSYNLRPRPKPAPRKLVRKVEISTSTLVTHL